MFLIVKLIRKIYKKTLVKVFDVNCATMPIVSERIPIISGKVSWRTRLAYSLGHIFNDLTAAMWFSYILIYLQRIALLAPITAGALLLLGQLVDALMTPIFGILVDKYSKKKVWHIIGSVLVTLSFPIIFGSFIDTSNSTSMVVDVIGITIFQTGWAAVQISHLSMIPLLTDLPLVRAELTAIRYSAQVGAAIAVFIVTWIILPTNESSVARLNAEDDYKFRNIVLIITTCGVATTIAFHAFLKSHLLESRSISSKIDRDSISNSLMIENNNNHNNYHTNYHSTTWLSITFLLRVALLYVASRLFITLATVYLPLYIEETDVGGKQALATVPLVSYLASLITSLLFKYINRSCGSKICYLLGILIGIIAAGIIEFAGNYEILMYVIAIFIGAASSITMVTALSITADFIGSRTETSALVYSIVTFLDKVVTGLIVIFIEKWRCIDEKLCPNYNRDTLAVVCAASMILGLIALMSISRCLT
ncbi:major facilitator superfamily domain-containing protein 12-like isoform X1 [Chelonus insularis]|uniref:major facilitator superfamily domain-containing protein 12-like isoform X1 n=1 Tax=Chelonus insularis TaxID=460826 RepID=UPI00158DE179|nr:major facilitator superfamily domain-containing protein 12-like isoform X1 [Chelonus insularis]